MMEGSLVMQRFLEQWLEWRRKNMRSMGWGRELWRCVEWVMSWILILGFSLWYLWEYVYLQLSSQLFNDPTNSKPKVPATCVPQTRISRTKPYWNETWIEFQEQIKIFECCQFLGDDDQRWITILRTSLRCRQLASILLFQDPPTDFHLDVDRLSVVSKLRRIWPHILPLPELPSLESYPYKISLIIPAYQVQPNELQTLLRHTVDHCHRPDSIQVIIVEAGGSSKLSDSMLLIASRFKTLEFHSYQGTNGRGGCLNFGASHAKGAILTFLHCDTFLPPNWDQHIENAFVANSNQVSTTTMCAFAMGIDVTPFLQKKALYPVGLWGADHVLGYLRCTVSRLPYGDSVLSFPASVFNYLGGYPEQPLMEDYDLVQLIRRRSLLFSSEQIQILNHRIACSPRRWQTHGVPYVIMANAWIIYRYKTLKTSADDLFDFYYNQSLSCNTVTNGKRKKES